MQFTILYPLFWILLVQITFGRVLREINHSDEFDFKNRRGVTYIKPPSMPPNFPNDDFNYTPERSNKDKLKYDIFEQADERPGGKLPSSPGVSQPSKGQLPPQKFGPVLFPDEEAAAGQNKANQDNGQSGENRQKDGTSGSLTNPPQDQRKSPDSDGNKQKEETKNQNVGSSSDRRNRPQDNRNRHNGNSNNGRDRPADRRNCSSPLGFIFCRMG